MMKSYLNLLFTKSNGGLSYVYGFLTIPSGILWLLRLQNQQDERVRKLRQMESYNPLIFKENQKNPNLLDLGF